jgi:chitodextrinase
MKKLNILKTIVFGAALALSHINAAAQCDYMDDFTAFPDFSHLETDEDEEGSYTVTSPGGWRVGEYAWHGNSYWANLMGNPGNDAVRLDGGEIANYCYGIIRSPFFSGGCTNVNFSYRGWHDMDTKLQVEIRNSDNAVVWSDTIAIAADDKGVDRDWHEYTKAVNITGTFRLFIDNITNNGNIYTQSPNAPIDVKNICLTANPTSLSAPAVSINGLHPRTAGGYWDSAYVSLSHELGGAAIYYTTDGTEPTTAATLYTAPFKITSTTQLKAIAVHGALTSAALDSTIVVATPTVSFVLPREATLFVGEKSTEAAVVGASGITNYLKVHYVPFTEKQPAYEDTLAGGRKRVFYGVSGKHNYRVSMPGKLTHVGVFTPPKTGSTTLEVTQAQLDSHSPKEVDHDVNSLNGRNHSDVYLNINAAGRLHVAKDSMFQLINVRVWQAIDSDVNNYFMEPDFHHSVVNEQGVEDTSVVAILPDGTIKAKKAGTAIVRVTYDAMMCAHTTNVGSNDSAFFSAIWPENTGVLVVTVSDAPTAPATGITPNMTIGELWSSGGTDKVDSTLIDAEHDVLYYEASTGGFGYTFKPAGVASVTLAQPALNDTTLSYSGFSANGVTAHPDGSYTVRLVHGRNIVKLTNAAGASDYQVISAKPVTWAVSGQSDKANNLFRPGDTIAVQFGAPTAPDGRGYPLYHPANKLSGIYNMSAGIQYLGYPTDFPLILGPGQYTFASRAQTYKIIIPSGYAGEEVALTNGVIKVQGFGSFYGEHRNITTKNGVPPNLNASIRTAYCGSAPSIYFRLTDAPSAPETIIATPDGETALNLSWTPSRDNGSIDGYNVYQNGKRVAYADTTAYKLTGLTPGASYLIEVEAVDDGDTKSSAKAQLTATTLDATPPDAPTALRATALTETSATLAWTKSFDNSGAVAKYVVYVDGDSVAETVDTACTVTGLTVVTTYAVKVAAEDAAGNKSAQSEAILIHTPDQTPPSKPGGLEPTAEEGSSVTLEWGRSKDNVGVAGYLVTLATTDNLAGDSVTFIPHTNSNLYSCTVGNLPAAAYIIGVQAVDTSGNRSPPAYFSKDGEAPTAPANLSATPTDTSVALLWAAATDNLGVIAGYIIYLNGDSTGVTTDTSFTLSGLTPVTEYALAVEAVDVAGNRSAKAQVTVSTAAAAVTGVRQVDGSAAIAYPNPFGSYLVVKAAADGEAVFYNMQGQAVLRTAVGAGSNRIGTSALPQGVYVVRCGSLTQMLLKR